MLFGIKNTPAIPYVLAFSNSTFTSHMVGTFFINLLLCETENSKTTIKENTVGNDS